MINRLWVPRPPSLTRVSKKWRSYLPRCTTSKKRKTQRSRNMSSRFLNLSRTSNQCNPTSMNWQPRNRLLLNQWSQKRLRWNNWTRRNQHWMNRWQHSNQRSRVKRHRLKLFRDRRTSWKMNLKRWGKPQKLKWRSLKQLWKLFRLKLMSWSSSR